MLRGNNSTVDVPGVHLKKKKKKKYSIKGVLNSPGVSSFVFLSRIGDVRPLVVEPRPVVVPSALGRAQQGPH